MNKLLQYSCVSLLLLPTIGMSASCLDLKALVFKQIEQAVVEKCAHEFHTELSQKQRKQLKTTMDQTWNSQDTLTCLSHCGAQKHQSAHECATEASQIFSRNALAEILPKISKEWCRQ